jgi:hypothetical protein
MSRILVEYCPCGHTGYLDKSKILPQVLEDLKSGKRLSAPAKHSDDCPQCEEDVEESNRMSLYWDLDI